MLSNPLPRQPADAAGVLLVNPQICRRHNRRMPLSVLNLAAVLEGRRPWKILDGNAGPILEAALATLAARPHALVGVTVMPGPQVAPAIEISAAIKAAHPTIPIAWGGYFPTLYPDAAINAPYVDYVVRGQGEATLLELLERLPDAGPPTPLDSARDSSAIRDVAGLTWKRDGRPVHNPERPIVSPDALPPLPYERLGDVRGYLRASFMGKRTAVHQAALGCRFKCDFCGVVSMWNGNTRLDAPTRLEAALFQLRDRWGADGVQFYDHNFFDREESSVPILEVLGRAAMPWWCFARADTLARFSADTWRLLRKSRLRMAYIGAEAASDAVLNRMKQGIPRRPHPRGGGPLPRERHHPRVLFRAGRTRRPRRRNRDDPGVHPPAEAAQPGLRDRPLLLQPDAAGRPGGAAPQPGATHLPVLKTYGPSGPALPTTPEEWTEPRWVSWVCHRGRPLADTSHPPAGEGLRARARVPVSDRPGPSHAHLGEDAAAEHGALAVRDGDVRQPDRAADRAAPAARARSEARKPVTASVTEPLTARPATSA